MESNHYKKMALMLILSFFIMYGVMFLNVSNIDHIYFSLTRIYMSILMVSPMALLMLVIMNKMYMDKKKNRIIALSSVFLFLTALLCLRSQLFISDTQYMKAMIPHHSSAILTSKNATIRKADVKRLSEHIVKSQEEEIQQMQSYIEAMEE